MLIMGSTARLSPAVYVCMLTKPAEARALLLPSPRSYGGPTAPPAHADKLECGPSSCLYPVGTSLLPGSTCWSLSFSTQTLCAPAALPSWEVLSVSTCFLPRQPAGVHPSRAESIPLQLLSLSWWTSQLAKGAPRVKKPFLFHSSLPWMPVSS